MVNLLVDFLAMVIGIFIGLLIIIKLGWLCA